MLSIVNVCRSADSKCIVSYHWRHDGHTVDFDARYVGATVPITLAAATAVADETDLAGNDVGRRHVCAWLLAVCVYESIPNRKWANSPN